MEEYLIKHKWFEKNYRRIIVDMHIDDWDSRFLTAFKPEQFVNLLKLADIQSAVIFPMSHVGHCFWPAKTGEINKNLKRKDLFGILVDLCHKKEIDVLAYYSTIFNNWAYERYPSWRMVDIDGKSSRELIKDLPLDRVKFARYGHCCPNSEGYRKFTLDQIREIVSNYSFEGMWVDMPFWTMVCYCDNCKRRYRKECGGEIPEVIDWNDPKWLCFQKRREEWINEYEKMIGDEIKKMNPSLTVTYNFALALSDWIFGVNEEIGTMPDYCTGDWYGGFSQQSFICKLFKNITNSLPFEFITSRCDPSLQNDHTTKKSRDNLKLYTYISLAHNGAFLFVDAIDPLGNMDTKVYETMSKIFKKSRKYEPYIGGNMIEDAAIYFSFNSKMDINENGKRAKLNYIDRTLVSDYYPHLDAASEASNICRKNHIPYGVISCKQVKELNNYKVIILPNVINLNEEEIKNMVSFVNEGGSLYISGAAPQGLLEPIFGIKYSSATEEKATYMAPTKEGKNLLFDSSNQFPLYAGSQVVVDSKVEGTILAKIVLPYTDPGDESKFASIHSNPPGKWTDHPSIIYKEYGKGKVLWTSYPIEIIKKEAHRKSFMNLIKKISNLPYSFESDAPAAVEIIIFHQPQNKRYIINIINAQADLPPVPVYDFKIRLNTKNNKILKASSITYKEDLVFAKEDGFIEIQIPKVEMFNMVVLKY